MLKVLLKRSVGIVLIIAAIEAIMWGMAELAGVPILPIFFNMLKWWGYGLLACLFWYGGGAILDWAFAPAPGVFKSLFNNPKEPTKPLTK